MNVHIFLLIITTLQYSFQTCFWKLLGKLVLHSDGASHVYVNVNCRCCFVKLYDLHPNLPSWHTQCFFFYLPQSVRSHFTAFSIQKQNKCETAVVVACARICSNAECIRCMYVCSRWKGRARQIFNNVCVLPLADDVCLFSLALRGLWSLWVVFWWHLL